MLIETKKLKTDSSYAQTVTVLKWSTNAGLSLLDIYNRTTTRAHSQTKINKKKSRNQALVANRGLHDVTGSSDSAAQQHAEDHAEDHDHTNADADSSNHMKPRVEHILNDR